LCAVWRGGAGRAGQRGVELNRQGRGGQCVKGRRKGAHSESASWPSAGRRAGAKRGWTVRSALLAATRCLLRGPVAAEAAPDRMRPPRGGLLTFGRAAPAVLRAATLLRRLARPQHRPGEHFIRDAKSTKHRCRYGIGTSAIKGTLEFDDGHLAGLRACVVTVPSAAAAAALPSPSDPPQFARSVRCRWRCAADPGGWGAAAAAVAASQSARNEPLSSTAVAGASALACAGAVGGCKAGDGRTEAGCTVDALHKQGAAGCHCVDKACQGDGAALVGEGRRCVREKGRAPS